MFVFCSRPHFVDNVASHLLSLSLLLFVFALSSQTVQHVCISCISLAHCIFYIIHCPAPFNRWNFKYAVELNIVDFAVVIDSKISVWIIYLSVHEVANASALIASGSQWRCVHMNQSFLPLLPLPPSLCAQMHRPKQTYTLLWPNTEICKIAQAIWLCK